jgi:hypothetical protein
MPINDTISFELDRHINHIIDILLQPDSRWTDKQLQMIQTLHRTTLTIKQCWEALPECDASPYLWQRSFDKGALFEIRTPLVAMRTSIHIIWRLTQTAPPQDDIALLDALMNCLTDINHVLELQLKRIQGEKD